jgi:hypothetical protein
LRLEKIRIGKQEKKMIKFQELLRKKEKDIEVEKMKIQKQQDRNLIKSGIEKV